VPVLRKHYRIVTERSPINLEQKVNDVLNAREEWKITGGVTAMQGPYGTEYAQSMYRQFRTKSNKGPSKAEATALAEAKEGDTNGS
jgi:hypothetical protein